MKLLYTNILPLGTENGQETVVDRFFEEARQADHIEIASGYISKASLLELDALVEAAGIKKIVLVIGMYFIEGMPEGTYHVALEINKKWQAAGIGEIRMVRAFKYHGKLYTFYKDGEIKSAIIGSANLGAIKLACDGGTDRYPIFESRSYEHAQRLSQPCSKRKRRHVHL